MNLKKLSRVSDSKAARHRVRDSSGRSMLDYVSKKKYNLDLPSQVVLAFNEAVDNLRKEDPSVQDTSVFYVMRKFYVDGLDLLFDDFISILGNAIKSYYNEEIDEVVEEDGQLLISYTENTPYEGTTLEDVADESDDLTTEDGIIKAYNKAAKKLGKKSKIRRKKGFEYDLVIKGEEVFADFDDTLNDALEDEGMSVSNMENISGGTVIEFEITELHEE